MYFIPSILAPKSDMNYKIRIHLYFSKEISMKICDKAPPVIHAFILSDFLFAATLVFLPFH